MIMKDCMKSCVSQYNGYNQRLYNQHNKGILVIILCDCYIRVLHALNMDIQINMQINLMTAILEYIVLTIE